MRHSIWMVLLLFSSAIYAKEYRLKLVLDPSQKLSDIHWDPSSDTQEPTLQEDPKDPIKGTPHVTLKGKYLGHNGNLLYQNKGMLVGPNGDFSIEVPVEGEKQDFRILEVSPEGDVKVQEAVLIFDDWKGFIDGRSPVANVTKKAFSWSPGLGFTAIQYQQSGWPTLVGLVLTPKVSVDYSVGDHWDIGANLFGTLVPLYSNPTGKTIHFFGGNLKTGYKVSLSSKQDWILKILAGYYYSTTLASTYGIGYQNVQGPELYPSISYHFPNDRIAWLYFKFSPIMNSIAFLDPSNFELATGGGFLFLPLPNRRSLGATFDVASMRLTFQGKSILSSSYTLGVHYRF